MRARGDSKGYSALVTGLAEAAEAGGRAAARKAAATASRGGDGDDDDDDDRDDDVDASAVVLFAQPGQEQRQRPPPPPPPPSEAPSEAPVLPAQFRVRDWRAGAALAAAASDALASQLSLAPAAALAALDRRARSASAALAALLTCASRASRAGSLARAKGAPREASKAAEAEAEGGREDEGGEEELDGGGGDGFGDPAAAAARSALAACHALVVASGPSASSSSSPSFSELDFQALADAALEAAKFCCASAPDVSRGGAALAALLLQGAMMPLSPSDDDEGGERGDEDENADPARMAFARDLASRISRSFPELAVRSSSSRDHDGDDDGGTRAVFLSALALASRLSPPSAAALRSLLPLATTRSPAAAASSSASSSFSSSSRSRPRPSFLELALAACPASISDTSSADAAAACVREVARRLPPGALDSAVIEAAGRAAAAASPAAKKRRIGGGGEGEGAEGEVDPDDALPLRPPSRRSSRGEQGEEGDGADPAAVLAAAAVSVHPRSSSSSWSARERLRALALLARGAGTFSPQLREALGSAAGAWVELLLRQRYAGDVGGDNDESGNDEDGGGFGGGGGIGGGRRRQRRATSSASPCPISLSPGLRAETVALVLAAVDACFAAALAAPPPRAAGGRPLSATGAATARRDGCRSLGLSREALRSLLALPWSGVGGGGGGGGTGAAPEAPEALPLVEALWPGSSRSRTRRVARQASFAASAKLAALRVQAVAALLDVPDFDRVSPLARAGIAARAASDAGGSGAGASAASPPAVRAAAAALVAALGSASKAGSRGAASAAALLARLAAERAAGDEEERGGGQQRTRKQPVVALAAAAGAALLADRRRALSSSFSSSSNGGGGGAGSPPLSYAVACAVHACLSIEEAGSRDRGLSPLARQWASRGRRACRRSGGGGGGRGDPALGILAAAAAKAATQRASPSPASSSSSPRPPPFPIESIAAITAATLDAQTSSAAAPAPPELQAAGLAALLAWLAGAPAPPALDPSLLAPLARAAIDASLSPHHAVRAALAAGAASLAHPPVLAALYGGSGSGNSANGGAAAAAYRPADGRTLQQQQQQGLRLLQDLNARLEMAPAVAAAAAATAAAPAQALAPALAATNENNADGTAAAAASAPAVPPPPRPASARIAVDPDAAASCRASLLVAIANAARACPGPASALLARVVLAGRLDDADAGVRAAAGALLSASARAAPGSPGVADFVLETPKLLEFVGRTLRSKPGLLGELAAVAGVGERALTAALLPAALPALVDNRDGPGIAALAERLGLDSPALLRQYGHLVVAKVLYEGTADSRDFEAFMAFFEKHANSTSSSSPAAAVAPNHSTKANDEGAAGLGSAAVVATGTGIPSPAAAAAAASGGGGGGGDAGGGGSSFISFVARSSQKVVAELLVRAGTSPEWARDGSAGPPPRAVEVRVRRMLAELARLVPGGDREARRRRERGEKKGSGDAMDEDGGADGDDSEEVAAFLASGDRVTRVLKAYGDALDAGFKPSGSGQRQQQPFFGHAGVPRTELATLRCVTLLVGLAGRRVGRFLPQLMVLLSSGSRPRDRPRAAVLQALFGWKALVAALAAPALAAPPAEGGGEERGGEKSASRQRRRRRRRKESRDDARPQLLAAAAGQVVVAMLEPAAEGGEVACAAAGVLEELVLRGGLPRRVLASLPPLPPVDAASAAAAAAPSLARVHAAVASARGDASTDARARALLAPLASPSAAVRATAAAELRSLLAGARSWLGGLLRAAARLRGVSSSSAPAASAAAVASSSAAYSAAAAADPAAASALLSEMVEGLMACCAPGVEEATAAAAAAGGGGARGGGGGSGSATASAATGNAALAAAECLGLIGAVDPALLSAAAAVAAARAGTATTERPSPSSPAGDEDTSANPGERRYLPARLLSRHLVRLLRVADSMQTLDVATFATQEVLRAYSSSELVRREGAAEELSDDGGGGGDDEDSDSDSAGMDEDPESDDDGSSEDEGDAAAGSAAANSNALLRALPRADRLVAAPFLHSQYKLVLGPPPRISRSRGGSVFAGALPRGAPAWRWLSTWLRCLVGTHVRRGGGRTTRRGGSGVEGEEKSPWVPLYEACLPVFRRDMRTSRFLLPHVVADALAGTASAGNGGGGANEEEEEAAAAARAAVVDEVCAVLRRGRESREGALCVQTVFALLDTLSAWVSTAPSEQLDPPRGARRPRVDANGAASAAASAAAASDAAAAALPTPVPPPLGAVDVRALASALALIPLPLLADAALAAGAHARATRYAETAARRRFGGALNPAANRRFSVPYDDATVSLLQTIAGRFGEPDGLSGLSHLRAPAGAPPATAVVRSSADAAAAAAALSPLPPPSPAGGGASRSPSSVFASAARSDELLAAEAAGAWGDALALYELELAEERRRLGEISLAAAASGGGASQGAQREDAAAAVLPLASAGPPLSPAAAAAEAEAEAARAAERAAAVRALERAQRGHLRCLLGMGHLEAALAGVDGWARPEALPPGEKKKATASAATAFGAQRGWPSLAAAAPSADGVANSSSRRLAAIGVAAAWRLGRWDALDEHLETARGGGAGSGGGRGRGGRGGGKGNALAAASAVFNPSASSRSSAPSASSPSSSPSSLMDDERWEVAVGGLLSALHRRDAEGFRRELAAARADVAAGPLRAAAMDLDFSSSSFSFDRAHGAVVRLHMLQEAADAAAVLRGALGSGGGSGLPRASSAAAAAVGPLERARRLRWEERLGVVQPSLSVQEPILALRRALCELAGDARGAGGCWLALARLCRRGGHLEAGGVAALEAAAAGAPGAGLERARLMWERDQPTKAQRALREEVSALAAARRKGELLGGAAAASEAEAVLQLADWAAVSGAGAARDVTDMYDAAISLAPRGSGVGAEAHFAFGAYLDALATDAFARQQRRRAAAEAAEAAAGAASGSSSSAAAAAAAAAAASDRLGGRSRIKLGEEQPFAEIVPLVLHHYGAALAGGGGGGFGGKKGGNGRNGDASLDASSSASSSATPAAERAARALPRLLTVFFEFGSYCASNPRLVTAGGGGGNSSSSSASAAASAAQRERAARADVLAKMQELVKALPLRAWLPALPQLTSRLCHAHAETRGVTRHLLTRVAAAHPHQALWALAAVSKSAVPARAEAAAAVLASAKRHGVIGGGGGGSGVGSGGFGHRGAGAVAAAAAGLTDDAAAAAAAANDRARRLHSSFAALCDQLIRLCHHSPPGRARSFSVSKEFAALARLFPCGVVVPVLSALATAPPADAPHGSSSASHPSALVSIAGIEDEVSVLSSLQKPKKITLLGSDGRRYAFLAKPKDDLRKDARMMEVAGVANALLLAAPPTQRGGGRGGGAGGGAGGAAGASSLTLSSPSSSSSSSPSTPAGLALRRFAVQPLTEDCGLVEWVPHTRVLRHCCQETYELRGEFDRQRSNAEIKASYDAMAATLSSNAGSSASAANARAKADWLARVLARFPPRLHEWYLARFPDPARWACARLAFARGAAAWSVVGHVVGLGDRHGENVLLDAAGGGVVHVDFSCLFDRGLTLEKPEVVPFRLTQNMVDACGVTGHEGAFRAACEATLGCLRGGKEALLSVLETFVHDPLVEWSRNGGAAGGVTAMATRGNDRSTDRAAASAAAHAAAAAAQAAQAQAAAAAAAAAAASERGNPQAQDALATMRGRLQGTLLGVLSTPCLPLGVEGQVSRLIDEAVDKGNLAAMYVWWMAWF